MNAATSSKLKDGLIAAAFAAAISLAVPIGAAAETCQTMWDNSSASDDCTTSFVMDGRVTDRQTGDRYAECDITASCSFEFTYGPGGNSSATVTPSLLTAVFSGHEVSLLTICVTGSTGSNGNAAYSARVHYNCDGTNEYTAMR